MLAPFVLALALPQVSAGEALVSDLNLQPATDLGGNPSRFSSNGQIAYFAAVDVEGVELWVSDGSLSGTRQVDPVQPGPVGSVDLFPLAGAATFFLPGGGGSAVYVGESQATGDEPWRVDGLAGTIESLGDLNPGPDGSGVTDFVEHQGALWFLADDGTAGRELWRTDGTPGGTALVDDALPGPDSFFGLNSSVHSTGNRLVLAAPSLGQLQFYATDGSPGGLVPFANFPTFGVEQPFNAGTFGAVNGRLVFGLRNPFNGNQGVWVTDGTASGTVRIIDFVELRWVVEDGGRLFLGAEQGINTEVWVTDGTLANTVQLTTGSAEVVNSSAVRGAMFAGDLYFAGWAAAAPGGNAGTELCVTDGTEAGTRLAVDLQPGTVSSAPLHFTTQGGSLYFVATDPVAGGPRLYRSGGTPGTTAPVPGGAVLNPTNFGNVPAAPQSALLPVANGLLTSRGSDAAGTQDFEPWLADANALGQLIDIAPPKTSSSDPRELTQVGDLLYFSASDGGFDRSLWRLDTTTGAEPVKVQVPNGGSNLDPDELTPWRGGLAFVGRGTNFFSYGIWWTDGQAVVPLAEITPQEPSQLTPSGDRLYFRRFLFGAPSNLRYVDGDSLTPAVVEFGAQVQPIDVEEIVSLGDGRVVGRASSAAAPSDEELFVSDGTPEGSFGIILEPSSAGSFPSNFVGLDGRAFFQATQLATGPELWVTDGTPAGTQLVVDATPGDASSLVRALAPWADGVVYAYVSQGVDSVRISDGTAAGTSVLANGPGIDAGPFVTVGERLFFPWGPGGTELWTSDGTAQGTGAVPGTGPGAIEVELFDPFAAFGSEQLAFVGDDGSGRELWASDGTQAGTTELTEFFGSAFFVDEADPIRVGSDLYLVADDVQFGEELFALSLAATGAPAVSSVVQGCGSSGEALEALDLPRIGAPFNLRVAGAAASAPAALFVDLDLLPLALGECTPLLPTPLQLAVAMADPTGVVDFPLALPANPALVGLSFYLRGATVAAGEPFLGIASLTNVLNVVPGQ